MAVYYNEIKKTFIESDLPIEVLEEKGYMPIWGAKLKLSSDDILKRPFISLVYIRKKLEFGRDFKARVLVDFVSGYEIKMGEYHECYKLGMESLERVKDYFKYLKDFIDTNKQIINKSDQLELFKKVQEKDMSLNLIPFWLLYNSNFHNLVPQEGDYKFYDLTGFNIEDINFDDLNTTMIALEVSKQHFDKVLGKNKKAITTLRIRMVKEVREVFEEELKVNEEIRSQYTKESEEIRQKYIEAMEATRQKYIGEIEKLQEQMDTLTEEQRFNSIKETFFKDISTIIQKSYLDFQNTLETTFSDIASKKQEIVSLSNKLNIEIDKKIRQAQAKIASIIEQEEQSIDNLKRELIAMEERKERLVSSITEEVVREVIKRNPAQEININLSDDNIRRKIRGIFHKSFKEVLQLVYLKTPVFLVGPAGCGKNVMLKQVAKVLDLDFYYINDAREKYDLLGFVDANGKYQETQFYKAFTKGGLLMIDELDSADPSVLLLLNSALGTGDDFYMTFPDGNQYQAHPNFHLVAAANTFGTGANQTYNGRNQLDGASLNRFLPVPVDYDTNIEKSLTNNQAILPLYWEVRRIVRENEINYVVSTRNILNADKYLSAKVFSLDKIFEWTLVGSLQDFDLATIISNIGTTDSYSMAFIEFVKRNYNIQEATNQNNNGYGNGYSKSYGNGYGRPGDYGDDYGNGYGYY